MIQESTACGLLFNQKQADEIVMGNAKRGYCAPDPHGKQHNELKGFWRILEYIPQMEYLSKGKLLFNKGKCRNIPPGAIIHQSVIDRIGNTELNYKPANVKLPMVKMEG